MCIYADHLKRNGGGGGNLAADNTSLFIRFLLTGEPAPRTDCYGPGETIERDKRHNRSPVQKTKVLRVFIFPDENEMRGGKPIRGRRYSAEEARGPHRGIPVAHLARLSETIVQPPWTPEQPPKQNL